MTKRDLLKMVESLPDETPSEMLEGVAAELDKLLFRALNIPESAVSSLTERPPTNVFGELGPLPLPEPGRGFPYSSNSKLRTTAPLSSTTSLTVERASVRW